MSVVAIVKAEGEDVEGAVRRAVALAGGLEGVIPSGASVLVKPNVVTPSPSGSGHITDARVTEAVLKLALECSPRRVILGEGSSVGYDFPGRKDTMHCLEASGTAEVTRRLGVPMVDLNRDERVEVRLPDAYAMHTFGVARTAWEADVILCLPVAKTHIRTGITCGLKNMKGVLPGDEKKRSHHVGLDRAIVDLNRAMRPHFTIVDALVAMQGTHTAPEDRVRLGRIVCGADVVAVDAVCAALMGFNVEQIHHLQLAAEAGLGEADLSRIEVRGESILQVAQRFITYQEAARDRFGRATLIEKDTCTGCLGEITSTLIYLNKAGFTERLKELILVMGMPDELPPLEGTPVVIGKCAQAHRQRGIFVPGCPPHGFAITDAACETLGIDQDVVHRAIEELHNF